MSSLVIAVLVGVEVSLGWYGPAIAVFTFFILESLDEIVEALKKK